MYKTDVCSEPPVKYCLHFSSFSTRVAVALIYYFDFFYLKMFLLGHIKMI